MDEIYRGILSDPVSLLTGLRIVLDGFQDRIARGSGNNSKHLEQIRKILLDGLKSFAGKVQRLGSLRDIDFIRGMKEGFCRKQGAALIS